MNFLININMKNSAQAKKQKMASPKTFQHLGKWVEKRTVSEILVCACGNKYIKTRKEQTLCIKCMGRQK